MYGRYDYTFHYENDDISLGMEKIDGFNRYFRKIKDKSEHTKYLLSDAGRIIINPVEPLNLPDVITEYLEIEFDMVFLEPYGKKTIYLKFPIEIGVFAAAKKGIEVLDIFSFVKPKYSLYGTASEGLITRWTKSAIHTEIPVVDPSREGVVQLALDNNTKDWVDISRVVFEGVGMKIYYGDIVSMVARMHIFSGKNAETEFFDHPLANGMQKSIELYTARELNVVKRTMQMEWGFT